MFTLVLVVGSWDLYQRVLQRIRNEFRPRLELRQNPPMVIHIPQNTAAQLGNHGVTRWAITDVHNRMIAGNLESQTPFIFYRDGAICNVHVANNIDDAVAEICDIPNNFVVN